RQTFLPSPIFLQGHPANAQAQAGTAFTGADIIELSQELAALVRLRGGFRTHPVVSWPAISLDLRESRRTPGGLGTGIRNCGPALLSIQVFKRHEAISRLLVCCESAVPGSIAGSRPASAPRAPLRPSPSRLPTRAAPDSQGSHQPRRLPPPMHRPRLASHPAVTPEP